MAIASDRGREIILLHERGMINNRIEDQVQAIKLILRMEEWMKIGNPTLEELNCLPDANRWNGNKIVEKKHILPPT